MKKMMKLLVGVLFTSLLAVGSFSVYASLTEDGAKGTIDGSDVAARKCPPFCI